MKLAFVVKTLDSGGGGAERVLTLVTSALADRGHDVTLVSFGADDEADFYPVDPRLKRLWLSAGRSQARSGIMDVIRRVASLRRALRAMRPDAAVGFMHSAYVPLAFAAVGTRIPVIASEHIVYDHYRSFPFEAFILRATAGLYARITIISQAIRTSFPDVLANKMVVIPNPVDPVTGEGADPVGGRRKILLNVGRMMEQKDQATLIRAFAKALEKHPDWILRIIGDGPLRAGLVELAGSLGVRDHVQMPGVTSDISVEYVRAQAFAMSSRYESFGIATAEALSAGLPAIGFADCPGTNELIKHGENGLLVNARSDRVEGLARALHELMSSSELRLRLGKAAPASVREYGLNAVVDRWEALAGEVASRAGRSSPPDGI